MNDDTFDLAAELPGDADPAEIGVPAVNSGRETVTDSIISYSEGMELFSNCDKAYSTFDVDGHLETWPIQSERFKDQLRRLYFRDKRSAPNPQALETALATIEAQARYSGKEIPVFVRVGKLDETVFVDLGNSTWDVVEISSTGFKVVRDPPVRFSRWRGTHPLPVPVGGGSLDDLRKVVNVVEEHWPLVVGWLLAAYHPEGPYPAAVLTGEQGSAKSTLSRILKSLTDPDQAMLLQFSTAKDMMIAASKTRVLAYDNLSNIRPEDSDAFCRLLTGGGYRVRALYTNDDETVIDVKRPLILNGIGDVVTKSDLLDRAIVLEAPRIPLDKRRTEQALMDEFFRIQPGVLGALFHGVSRALREKDTLNLQEIPRLADIAVWVTAAEPELGFERGAFSSALASNKRDSDDIALESSPVVEPLMGLLSASGAFSGTSSQLLEQLETLVSVRDRSTRTGWPKTPQALGSTLSRLAPSLRAKGVEIVRRRSTGLGSQRVIEVSFLNEGPGPVAGVAPCQQADSAAQDATARHVIKQHSETVTAGNAPIKVMATEILAPAQRDGCDTSHAGSSILDTAE